MKKMIILAAVTAMTFGALASEPGPAPVSLRNEQYVEAAAIPDKAVYRVSTTVGHDVEIQLGEESAKNELWQPVSYNPDACRLKIDHEKKGFWPFTREYAEIEIKGLVRGQQELVLQCGTKRIIIRVNTI